MTKTVIHRDGSIEHFQTEKIIRAIQAIVHDLRLEDPFVAVFKIIKNFELKLPDQIRTEDIDELLLKAIEPLISDDPLFDKIATRQLAKIINKSVTGRFQSFSEYVRYAVDEKLLDSRLLDFDLGALELSINHEYDEEFNYFGLATLKDRYLMRDRSKDIIEQPQWMWMRVAMGLSIPENTAKEAFALQIYQPLAQLKYLHSTPTLYNSGMPFSQLSSCYINVVGDSMDNIMDKAKETAMFAKYAGGVGSSVTKLRAAGSHIKSINAKSSGPIPFIKIFDTVVNGIMQGGRRRSSQVIYMEPWHYNIEDFLELKETNGSEYLRTRSLNTALWIPDEFMKRVDADQDWYLFDPAEIPALTQTRGAEFEKAYQDAIDRANIGKIKLFKKLKARDLYRECLQKLAKTGNYRFNFKDRHNEANQAPSYSMIHSSNLCTEISIPNSEDSTAVCTLASLNLVRFLKKDLLQAENFAQLPVSEKLQALDWADMGQVIGTAIHALDNVLEINFYPSAESEKNSLDLRPLGLGFMGLAELFIELGIAYDSEDALTVVDQIGSFMYSKALEESQRLCTLRGPFRDRDPTRYSYAARRNALLLAIAPTASISLIAGTSSTVDSYFANVYSRETLGGKFTIVITQLIDQLKAHGLWNDRIKSLIVNAGGSIQHIEELDGIIDKSLFKTAYEFSRQSQIAIAATLQKYIDQAISRNMYIPESQRPDMENIYMEAWKAGLKGTYYCFIEKTIQGEKYTEQVNKRGERLGFRTGQTQVVQVTSQPVAQEASVTAPAQRGFGAMAHSTDSVVGMPKPSTENKSEVEAYLRATKGDNYVEDLKAGKLYNGACPVDPFEKVMCESCQ